MPVLVLASVGTAEGCFHRENVWDVKFFEHGDTCCAVFEPVHGEATLFERKEITELGKYVWEDTCLMWPFLYVVAIHENVFSPGMSMQVYVKQKVTLLGELSYQFLNSEDDRVDDS